MNSFSQTLIKVLRKGYLTIRPDDNPSGRNWKMFSNKEYSNQLIRDALDSPSPCMIARFGSTEMLNLTNFLGTKQGNRNILGYITGKSLPWWWEKTSIDQLQNWSGFFPATIDGVNRFCQLMINDVNAIDILGSWLKEEIHFEHLLVNTKRVVLEDLEPFFCKNPWTKALEGKNVLVIHPFAETIESQYKRRNLLFDDGLLPEFNLKTIKAVQTIAGNDSGFIDWFSALDYMKQKIDEVNYDICIIGAGAYGLPLAAHVKRSGKKAIHLAGATQLLFGIKGKRWEEFVVWPYMNLFNEHWVRPGEKEKPQNASIVENACYW